MLPIERMDEKDEGNPGVVWPVEARVGDRSSPNAFSVSPVYRSLRWTKSSCSCALSFLADEAGESDGLLKNQYDLAYMKRGHTKMGRTHEEDYSATFLTAARDG